MAPRRPHDYTQIDPTLADEVQPHAPISQMIDDVRSGKRNDLPALLVAGLPNIGGMPLKMATPEGIAGLGHDVWRAIKTPYDVPVSYTHLTLPTNREV